MNNSSNVALNNPLTNEPENQKFKKQDSTARSVQEKNKNLFKALSATVGDSINTNLNQVGTIPLKQNEIQRKNNEHESLLESVKSTLKPIPSYFKTKMNGDDLNSITSSDFSNRSDIEKMSAVNDFIITNLNAENSHLSKQTDENKNNYISNENNEKSIIFSKSNHSFHSTNSKISDTEDFDVKN